MAQTNTGKLQATINENGEAVYQAPIEIKSDADLAYYGITKEDCRTLHFGKSEKIIVYYFPTTNRGRCVMKSNDVIREVMKRRNMTANAMVEILGIKQPTMSQRLKQNNLSTDKMIEMLNIMGYRLVAIPKITDLPEEVFC